MTYLTCRVRLQDRTVCIARAHCHPYAILSPPSVARRVTTVHVLSRTVRVLLFEDATVQRCREASADTVLMMMNGIGPVGTLDGPDSFLKPLSEIFKPGGQILVDYGDVHHRQVVTGTGRLDWPARYPQRTLQSPVLGLQTSLWRDGVLRGMPQTT